MPSKPTATGERPATMEKRGGPGTYFSLLAVQTLGATIVMMKAVPIYRRLIRDFDAHEPAAGILWWELTGVVLIQCAYWLSVRLQPPLLRKGHMVLGHLASFVARLSFILVSSTFVVVFLIRFDQLSLPPHRLLILLALLFSMFCWTLSLERLARSLLGADGKV